MQWQHFKIKIILEIIQTQGNIYMNLVNMLL